MHEYRVYLHFDKAIFIPRDSCVGVNAGDAVERGVVAFEVLAPVSRFKPMKLINNYRSAFHNADHQEKIRVCRNHLFHQVCMSHHIPNDCSSRRKLT